ncbi:hypothetical protein E2C01_083557 [Portunus trituberculatus]|uniref:Uncharacterized protein n=1 Tax=Portunus trituberculatus TaxID=210409 RepID=A0A5B7ISS8_PORTR|nr:hypothetical protein [Portunus trituberculatus]
MNPARCSFIVKLGRPEVWSCRRPKGNLVYPKNGEVVLADFPRVGGEKRKRRRLGGIEGEKM